MTEEIREVPVEDAVAAEQVAAPGGQPTAVEQADTNDKSDEDVLREIDALKFEYRMADGDEADRLRAEIETLGARFL